MPTPWPLVGRAAELDAVTAAMDADAPGVLLAGPPGVGKTRLATECLELAAERGWSSAVVRANRAAASIPYGAFAPHLPRAFRSAEGEADALRQAAHAMVGEAGDGRLLLLVDDAHELDDASAALLHLLAGFGPLFLVVTIRTESEAPSAVTALWKDDLLARIEVPTLDGDATAALVATALGGPVDGGTAQALWRASGGNALFLRELIIGARDAGALRDAGGLWRLTGALAPSTRLGEVVGLRLGRLSDAEHEVVELVAVGEPVSLDDLVQLVQSRSIDDLQRRALIDVQVEVQRRQVRMAHPLYGEVVRAGIPEQRRRELLTQLADAVEGHGANRREDVLRTAVWRLDAGGSGRPELLVAAARQARGAEDFQLSIRLAEAARANGAGPEAAHLLGLGLDDVGDHVGAEAVLAAGEAEERDPSRRAEISIARAGNLFRGLGRADDAERVVRAAEQSVEEPILHDALIALRGTFRVFEGRVAEAHELIAPLYLEETDLAVAQGALADAVALALAGRTAEAVDIVKRGRAARANLPDHLQLASEGMFLVAEAQALLEAGQMRDATDLARFGYDAAVDIGSAHGQAWFGAILGRIAIHRGMPENVARWSRESGIVWREINHPSARWGFGGVACGLAMSGRLDEADAAFAELDAQPVMPVGLFDPEIDRGRAWVAAQRGEHTRACEILVAAADASEANGALALTAGALHDLARLGELRLAVERFDAILARADSPYVEARAAHAQALLDEDAEALDAVSERFEAMGAMLVAAEAASAAAALHRQAALARRATASARRADTLLAECVGARPLGAVPQPAGVALTRREREVAQLAAGNLTSREIADQLFVSVRTVENHLQRAYEKLGVTGRRELAEALEQEGNGR